MVTPTAKQVEIRDEAALDLVVVAPAGCGKTEALALRVQGLLDRGVVKAPRRVLVVTFSNRARDNIRDRLRSYLSPAAMRDRITVSNFHGLSARLFRAHANVIGLDPTMTLPENDWVGNECRRRGLDYQPLAAVQEIMRTAKQEALDDAAVMSRIRLSKNPVAIEIEELRLKESRLTYDDLPRTAELILANSYVAALYQSHFAAVVVDEFQDLTPQQLRIVNAIGSKKTTFAGDIAQGIYSFAGAKPAVIDAAIRSECSTVIEFNESHRSSPAVLATVNSLVPLTAGQLLTSADPASWPGGGIAASVQQSDAYAEAEWVLKLSRAILARAPSHRVGVLTRIASRRRFIDAAFAAGDLTHYRWDDGVLDTDTAKIVKGMLAGFSLRGYVTSKDKTEFLRTAAGFEAVIDPSGRESLAGALAWVYDLLAQGELPEAIRERVKVGDANTLITMPGVHLLNGHVGKGQQFDWVVVAGVEDRVIPFFNATSAEEKAEEARVLSVMISRARHGVILSHAESVPTLKGASRAQSPSPYFAQLKTADLTNSKGLIAWMKEADWSALAKK